MVAEGFDLSHATITTRIDGAVVHYRAFDGLVRDLPQLIEAVTAFMTLEDNDVLLIGPPDAGPEARPGAVVTIEVPGLVTLSHSLVSEGSS